MSLLVLSGRRQPSPVTLPALSRQQLAALPTRFGGGVWGPTTQLGMVPSWGVELGMLTAKSDRDAVRAAHRAASAKAIWYSLCVHYQESGVAYPNEIAGWNDFTGDGFAQAVSLAQETAADGLYPFVQLGGDELGSQWVRDHIAAIADAFRAGGLAGRVCFVPTFDSDADGDWSYPACNWAETNLVIRQALRDDFALATWLPAGWARLGYIPGVTPVAEGEACVDRWSLEGPGGLGEFLAPWPAIVGAEIGPDGNWVPVYASDATRWNQFVQPVGRRVKRGSWVPPPDAPYNVLVDGHLVSCDENPPPTYSTPGQTCVWEESHTDDWTHQTGITAEQIDTERQGALACGCDAVG